MSQSCGTASDSCCTSLPVPGGSYFRSYDFLGDPASGDTKHPAKVSGFRLDEYEVTVGRFRAFVQAGMGTQLQPPASGSGPHPNVAGSGWDSSWNTSLVATRGVLTTALKCDPMFQTWTELSGDNENRPINCVTWYEAFAFCIWDGGYLPTEAEWNYAAAGGDEQRLYPWSIPSNSTVIDGVHASYSDDTDGLNCTGDGISGCALTDLIAVGTKSAGVARWGQLEMAGNVVEWVLDSPGSYADPCTDCMNPATTTRGARGGSYHFAAMLARAGFRYGGPPATRTPAFGLRCARAM